ncbi:MAG: hypothetical protein B6I38_10145 [Anaerolineaceae bacterium 4572_5.1]|nr:MAG: hypothetical protein B6I38_10145 [Anaerolineaceae bacterium 4572_5.1]
MKPGVKGKIHFSRRDFLKLTGRVAGLSLIAGLGGWKYISQIEPGDLELVELSLALPRLNPVFSGFKIAAISDIHIGGWMTFERLTPVVDMVLAQEPDLVLLLGDFMHGYGWDDEKQACADSLAKELLRLSERTTTLAVMGNHDYWTSAPDVRRALENANVIELSNATYSLTRDSSQLHFCGVDDIWEGQDDLDEILAQLPAEGSAILMAHEPDFADTSAATGRFDLQISGHTHGGQVVIPGYGPPVRPPFGEKYISGLYKVGEMWQYTNRGVGTGRIPVRFNCRPEVTVFTLITA